MSKRILDFTVLKNRPLTSEFFVLELTAKEELPQMKPGQFVEIKVTGSGTTFLRRPLSIHDVDNERNVLILLIQQVGDGTRKLSELKTGELVNLVLPLGNAFTLPENKEERLLLVGGGCGVAPLLFLAKYLKDKGYLPEFLLGYRSNGHILELEEYEKLGAVHLTTEDGSAGHKGFVIHHPVLFEADRPFSRIYTCGPDAMMKAVAKYAKKRSIFCEVSLEHTMACGIGACLCCVVETINGNVCTCTDGPVFNIKELTWQI